MKRVHIFSRRLWGKKLRVLTSSPSLRITGGGEASRVFEMDDQEITDCHDGSLLNKELTDMHGPEMIEY